MKVRIHWGIGLSIALICFMIFIIYISFIRKNVESELVSDRYYEDEMKYQEIIDERNNANALDETVSIKVLPIGIKICFPKKFSYENTMGQLNLMRPSNKGLDVQRSLDMNIYGEVLIPRKMLQKGCYILIMRWESKGKKYFVEKNIIWKI
ncbi:FixH family protein [Candidatus Walczuchella monophlebidarum]|uniref:Cytochrome cbb3 oxidase maturation protein CcoH n=1 Tax=Candidatus Walczuchella monophlebidarum TaxID=1415657 RepID=A0A068DSH3_9FLAO|nr:FixH family protein [Candidatus Walczuchella monophlebidarum]AID37324.1 cytochrome cbb3 oxidase maturation protein CcoH [Candidatus Walczuchella monophlebidarum]